MRILFLFLILLFTASCKNKITANTNSNNTKVTEGTMLTFDPFALATHKVTGNCQSQPILHRFLNFSPIYLQSSGTDLFVGNANVILYDATATFDLLYTEYPGQENTDQTTFSDHLTGNYHYEKSTIANAPDNLVLENIGTIIPSLSSNKISFRLKLDHDLNRAVTANEILGGVRNGALAFFNDTCP
jgi:hypothetical protein